MGIWYKHCSPWQAAQTVDTRGTLDSMAEGFRQGEVQTFKQEQS